MNDTERAIAECRKQKAKRKTEQERKPGAGTGERYKHYHLKLGREYDAEIISYIENHELFGITELFRRAMRTMMAAEKIIKTARERSN